VDALDQPDVTQLFKSALTAHRRESLKLPSKNSRHDALEAKIASTRKALMWIKGSGASARQSARPNRRIKIIRPTRPIFTVPGDLQQFLCAIVVRGKSALLAPRAIPATELRGLEGRQEACEYPE
jgi:hypothetical protein